MNDEQSHTSSIADLVAPESEIGHTPHSKAASSGVSFNDPAATPTPGSAPTFTMLDIAHVDENPKGDGGFRKTVSKTPKKRDHEWHSPLRRQGPLKLLDLPIDVLQEIVKEITHTNDLTALALTHSSLHSLAIPHIYSRFDIVWPDATSTSDTRTGVDALTYGLSTLVMSHQLYESSSFLEPPEQLDADASATPPPASRMRLGNNYSIYTKKFSLGNGPSDWVQDYMITKESGKMLGTLVALAVARMVNLETFVWDMPTGVLRDVFLSLSSLERKRKSGDCRLEKFLVRWHDNSLDQPTPPMGSSLANPPVGSVIPPNSIVTSIGIPFPQDNPLHPLNPQYAIASSSTIRNTVEQPTLSVLPPLKSLSVLDIDEVSYLDEMSILIERSKDRLQELRVGISRKACERPFVMPWDSVGLHQVDHDQAWSGAPSNIGERRLGGVLGIIMGRVFDIHRSAKAPVVIKPQVTVMPAGEQTDMLNGIAGLNLGNSAGTDTATSFEQDSQAIDMPNHDLATVNALAEGAALLPIDQGQVEEEIDASKLETEPLIDGAGDVDLGVSSNIISPAVEISQINLSPPFEVPASVHKRPSKKDTNSEKPAKEVEMPKRKLLSGKLRLQVLELERVPLSIYVLQKAFDWTTLRSLTILDCAYHESLWRMLRRQFRPQLSANSSKANPQMEYQLNLKHIHTDIATPSLISFLKETLAPNTLEVLFLQDRRQKTTSLVTIDAIYKGPLRRHRKSLKKLLIDSSDRIPRSPAVSSDNARWKTWMLSKEALTYITSGNMSNLKELSVAVDYRDWHLFLRRLPNIPSLRSLNIPFIGDHVTPAYDPKELAMQVVDMIFLRPEIELCYLGISNKCFEILENRPVDDRHGGDEPVTAHGELGEQMTEDEEDEDGESDVDDEDDDDDADDDDGTATEAVETEGVEYELSDGSDEFDGASEVDSDTESSRLSLRLREILFYDDKVAIFKARHMRL